jgi:hypothetical protein
VKRSNAKRSKGNAASRSVVRKTTPAGKAKEANRELYGSEPERATEIAINYLHAAKKVPEGNGDPMDWQGIVDSVDNAGNNGNNNGNSNSRHSGNGKSALLAAIVAGQSKDHLGYFNAMVVTETTRDQLSGVFLTRLQLRRRVFSYSDSATEKEKRMVTEYGGALDDILDTFTPPSHLRVDTAGHMLADDTEAEVAELVTTASREWAASKLSWIEAYSREELKDHLFLARLTLKDHKRCFPNMTQELHDKFGDIATAYNIGSTDDPYAGLGPAAGAEKIDGSLNNIGKHLSTLAYDRPCPHPLWNSREHPDITTLISRFTENDLIERLNMFHALKTQVDRDDILTTGCLDYSQKFCGATDGEWSFVYFACHRYIVSQYSADDVVRILVPSIRRELFLHELEFAIPAGHVREDIEPPFEFAEDISNIYDGLENYTIADLDVRLRVVRGWNSYLQAFPGSSRVQYVQMHRLRYRYRNYDEARRAIEIAEDALEYGHRLTGGYPAEPVDEDDDDSETRDDILYGMNDFTEAELAELIGDSLGGVEAFT